MTRRVVVAVALGFAPVVAFAPVFGRTGTSALLDPAYAGPAAGTVAGTAILTLLLARVAPAIRTLVVSTALLAPAALLLRAFDGPKRLLTSALPLDPTGPELAAVCVLCGLAALGALEGALRRTSPVLPLLAPIAGTAIGATLGDPARWLAPAIVLAALVLLWRRWAATALVVLIVASTALAPVLLGDRARFDPRSLVPQPVQPLIDTSPLAQFAAIRSGRLPLSLRVESRSTVTRMRYVSLDTFDGDYWTSTTKYRRAGHRLPTKPSAAIPMVEHVWIDRAGPLGWLVASGRPTEVSVSGLGVNEADGEVVFPDDRPVPASYTVHSELPVWDEKTLTEAVPAAAPAAPVPPDLAQAAQGIVAHEYGHPALSLLADHFAREGSGYGVVEPRDARPGHGLLHIRQLLAERQGSAEQYASAFAVLARSLGYDSRVTVGFVPRREAAGVYTIAGRDIDAWAEVRFEGLGWVPYFPTPGQHASPAERPKAPEPEPTPQPAAPPDDEFTPDSPAAQAPAAEGFPWVIWGAGAVGALVILAVFVPPAVKLLRRRRRRRGAPAQQILGAWRDTVDRFREAGLPTPASATATELARAAATRFTPALRETATQLARMHDAAAFGSTDPDGAPTAWRHANHIRVTLRRSLRPHRRVAAALSPRPLLRHRRTPGFP